MRVGEVADVLLGYGVYNALNLDGGGSTSMAMQDPADNVRKYINVRSDTLPRNEASNLAVVLGRHRPRLHRDPVSLTQRSGWNNDPAVGVTLVRDRPPQRQDGHPPGLGGRAPVLASTARRPPRRGGSRRDGLRGRDQEGVTTVTYFATDAADNDEGENEVTVRIDRTQPDVPGLPGRVQPLAAQSRDAAGCRRDRGRRIVGCCRGWLERDRDEQRPVRPGRHPRRLRRGRRIRGVAARRATRQRARGAPTRSPRRHRPRGEHPDLDGDVRRAPDQGHEDGRLVDSAGPKYRIAAIPWRAPMRMTARVSRACGSRSSSYWAGVRRRSPRPARRRSPGSSPIRAAPPRPASR